MKHPIHIKTYREQEVVYDADNDMFFVINNKSLSGVTCQSFKEIKEQIDNYVDGEFRIDVSDKDIWFYNSDGSKSKINTLLKEYVRLVYFYGTNHGYSTTEKYDKIVYLNTQFNCDTLKNMNELNKQLMKLDNEYNKLSKILQQITLGKLCKDYLKDKKE